MDGCVAMTKKAYHYTESGLDWVYLVNGYEIHKTPHGEGVSIQDLGGLHAYLAEIIISSQARIRGQELKFLRSLLDLSQSGLGRVIGLSRPTIARLESKGTTPIPGAADRVLRLFYALKLSKHEVAEKICELLAEIDEHEYQQEHLQQSGGEWRPAA
jgi:putative transcriptional regulator